MCDNETAFPSDIYFFFHTIFQLMKTVLRDSFPSSPPTSLRQDVLKEKTKRKYFIAMYKQV